MRLPSSTIEPDEALEEFDQWVTSSLGDIRETEKYISELDSLHSLFARLSQRLDPKQPAHTEAADEEIRDALKYPEEAGYRLIVLLSAVFLATGRSDNAVKCQYPIAYLHKFGHSYPRISRGRVVRGPVPRVIKSTDMVDNSVKISQVDPVVAQELITDYLGFLLSSPQDRQQFLALIDAFRQAESRGAEAGRHLLAPLVIFQVRGSVAATGGHDPEQIVRDYAREWGLLPHVDFNATDMTAHDLHHWVMSLSQPERAAEAIREKTRAFDFIIPCRSAVATKRIFVQSQFYAGDSGSVSHKNVDQAAGARRHAVTLFPTALFVELVDGAGYCASLRKDLQHLIFAEDTYDFVQVRSIPVRLRRIMQEAGVFSPLDLAIRVQAGVKTSKALKASIVRDGASHHHYEEVATSAVCRDWLVESDGNLSVHPERTSTVDEYALLDQIAIHGNRIDSTETGRVLLVPGYGPNYGVLRDEFEHDVDIVQRLIDRGIIQTMVMAL